MVDSVTAPIAILLEDNAVIESTGRRHTVIQLPLEPIVIPNASVTPITENVVDFQTDGEFRVLKANGISQHLTGKFPNQGNPHSIRVQQHLYKVPISPQLADKSTPLGLHYFGIGVNGVPFDPLAAEWYLGDRSSIWQYEALTGALNLGFDQNHAHVQPSGAYHYHGWPELLAERLNVQASEHSPIIGWAADGFPIYALYGYQDAMDENSGIVKMTSSYHLKTGNRPADGQNPGGSYDGTFVADFEFVEGAGSLDDCNGRFTKTPDFPEGTYAYFLTDPDQNVPVVPRCYKGTPSKDFTSPRSNQPPVEHRHRHVSRQ